MSLLTLAVNALFFLAIAVLFLYVGRIVQARPLEESSTRAGRLFALWWYALGTLALVQGSASVFGAAGIDDPLPYILIIHVGNLIQVVALWSLLYYVLFVYTGRQGFFWPLAAFYGLVAAGLVYYVQNVLAEQDPSVLITAWDARLDFDLSRADPILQLLLAALILPQLGALVAYFTIVFGAAGREQRYRVLLISTSLFVWLASSYVASATTSISESFWVVAGRVLAMIAGLMVIAAFRPPSSVRAWIAGRPKVPIDTLEGFAERVRRLV